MSVSNYVLNQRISNLQYEIDQLTPPPGGYVTVNGNQTINNVKTFTSAPQCSVVPVSNNDLVNKLYVTNATSGLTLAGTLNNGNSAGASNINMNNNNITNGNNINGVNFNASNQIQINDGSGSLNTSNASTISIDNTANTGPVNTLSAGDISIHDFGSTTTSILTADKLELTSGSGANIGYIDATQAIFTQSGVGFTINSGGGGYITFDNGTGGSIMNINGANQLSIDSNTLTGLSLNSRNNILVAGDVNDNYNHTKMLINDNHYNIDLQAYNLSTNSNTFTLPIVFTSKSSAGMSYGAPNNWIEVYHYSVNMPSFVVDVNSSYNIWKLDFNINMYNNSNTTDKAFAMYFDFSDTNNNYYTPWLYNQSTPYTRHANQSTYSASSQDTINYNWGDYLDLTNVNSAVPLEFHLYVYADNPINSDFQMLVHFTRTNLI